MKRVKKEEEEERQEEKEDARGWAETREEKSERCEATEKNRQRSHGRMHWNSSMSAASLVAMDMIINIIID